MTAKITTASTTASVTVTAMAAGPNSEAEDAEASTAPEDESGMHDAGAGPDRVNPLGQAKHDVTAGSAHVLQLLSQMLPAGATVAAETRTALGPRATTGNKFGSFGTCVSNAASVRALMSVAAITTLTTASLDASNRPVPPATTSAQSRPTTLVCDEDIDRTAVTWFRNDNTSETVNAFKPSSVHNLPAATTVTLILTVWLTSHPPNVAGM
jgi:hypothetical protein